jgi:hypothetical protein
VILNNSSLWQILISQLLHIRQYHKMGALARSQFYFKNVVLLITIFLRFSYSQENIQQFHCPEGWKLRGLSCYQFFNIRHSWQKASDLCKRYGSDLTLVESVRQNNATAAIASELLPDPTGDASYWLGLQAHNELNTYALTADAGRQISAYHGHWALGQPNVVAGKCVRAVLDDAGGHQSWELASCEELHPFLCRLPACPSRTFHCSNGKCVNDLFRCDGEDDCGDDSDELACEENCRHHKSSAGHTFASLSPYQPYTDCKWTLEGPPGTNIILDISTFETEEIFDTVQILGGGRTENTAVNIATLSGRLVGSQKYESASNFMIVKFKTDGQVERSGFSASWRAEIQACESSNNASTLPQVLMSKNFPSPYPGGLECLDVIHAGPGKIVTLEIEDLDMEPDKDTVLIRDGSTSTAPVLATLSGQASDHPRFIVSTGPSLYLLTRTDQAESRRGFRIKYYEGCNVTLDLANGTLLSPAYESASYPLNQKCFYRLKHPVGGRLSLLFMEMRLDDEGRDTVRVFNGRPENGGRALHTEDGFTGSEVPAYSLSADAGEMVIEFSSDASSKGGRGFKAIFSADCPDLRAGAAAIGSSLDTIFGTQVEFTCPTGQTFATGADRIVTECMPGGRWSQSYIPACRQVYCGPVPQIDNGFAIRATNVSYQGTASYQGEQFHNIIIGHKNGVNPC